MSYDDGQVLQGLQVKWTFLGATLLEWAAGFSIFLLLSIFAKPGKLGIMVPFMVGGWVGTTVALASFRNVFPDEERGLRNMLMTKCGFRPIDIPAPASLQPLWSATPLRELPEDWRFTKLGLDEALPSFRNQLLEADEDGEDVL